MIASLPLFHRIAGQRVIVLGMGDAADAKRRLVERAGGIVIDDLQEGIDKGARLAFVAHDDRVSAEADTIRLRCAGLLVNAADRPELCDFTVPSILDRDPVLIAVGTGGASAGLAKALRLRLEALLPPTLGALAKQLYAARDRLRVRWPDAGDRRRALDAALAERGVLDPLREESARAVDEWLTSSPLPFMGGAGGGSPPDQASYNPENSHPNPSPEGEGLYGATIIEIALRSADPDDLTLREARWLGSADIVAYEAGVPPDILDRARADAARVRLGGEYTGSDMDRTGLVVILRLA
jgi:uroporphyrin-III C-methyltransferase/precorrin-2 dehydrogenase/sirohydrochlorin ferrochelatase